MSAARVRLELPVSRRGPVLSWSRETVDRLAGEACRVAREMGIRLDDDREGVYVMEAERKGARVDRAQRVVRFTDRDIEETLAVMRSTRPAPAPLRPAVDAALGRDETFVVGNGGNLLFDWSLWQVRPPTPADMVSLCRWAQGEAAVSGLFAPVMLKDVDQLLEPMVTYALLGRHCRKTIYHPQPTEPAHVKYLDRMARAVERRRGFYQPMPEWEYVNPPFRLGARSVRTMLYRGRGDPGRGVRQHPSHELRAHAGAHDGRRAVQRLPVPRAGRREPPRRAPHPGAGASGPGA